MRTLTAIPRGLARRVWATAMCVAWACAAHAAEPNATVNFLAFDATGARLADIVIENDGATVFTDADGRAVMMVQAGMRTFSVRSSSQEPFILPAIPCITGTELDVIITFDDTGALLGFDVPFLDGAVPTPQIPRASDPADGEHAHAGLPPKADDAAAPSQHSPRDGDVPAASTLGRRMRVVVRDALRGVPLAEVRCDLSGKGFVGMTDTAGTLTFDAAEASGAVSFVRAGYSPRVVPLAPARSAADHPSAPKEELQGDSQGEVHIDVDLYPAADALDDLVVRAPHIEGTLAAAVEERREEKSVVEVMGADQIRRSGDGDAAAALRRATGLTVVGGRYVYVRGLGERYSATLFDGMNLPSPEPERRVVPLDMFPTAALSGLVVQKSWSPDLPGEFGGGAVLIRTRRVPDRPFFDVSVGTGGMFGSTFNTAPVSQRGNLALLGLDDGSRALPQIIADASKDQLIAERNTLSTSGYTPKELERFGEALSRDYTPKNGTILPNASLNTAFGAPVDVGFGELGILGALTWGSDEQYLRLERRTVALDGKGNVTARDEGQLDATDRSITLGALVNVGLEMSGPLTGHALQATTFVNRVTDDEVRVLQGFEDDANTLVRATRLRWVERTLLSQRIAGTHPLSILSSTLEWHYGYALALRDEPDLREVRYDQDLSSGAFLLVDRPEGNQRMFSGLDDHAHDAQLAWRLPVAAWDTLWGSGSADLRLGARVTSKQRAVDTRRYKFVARGPAASSPELRALDAEAIFTPNNIGSQGFQVVESTRNTDNYGGNATVGSFFAVADLPLPGKLTLTGGARLEISSIGVTTFELFNAAATPVTSALNTVDVFPALAATWAFRDDMQLRATSALTASRPELRELSPAVFTDVTGGRSRYGNPDLKPATIVHGDLRWEWYPTETESISAAAFAKQFNSPIETIITAGSDQAITWANAQSALNVGVEAELRLELERVTPLLRGLFVAGNGALIVSRVTLPADGIQTSKERPLEGQSPWVANVQLGWERESWGTRATALYNVAGPRVREVGVLGAPDVYEQPVHQVDLVMSQELVAGLRLNLRAQNLLGAAQVTTQGSVVTERVARAPVVAASLGMRF